MKFRTLLTEATLIKRSFRFLLDVELKNKKVRTLYCPNLGPLPYCEVLGTKIWFRTANRLSQGYLDVLELIEVNQSVWIAVNPDYAQALVREGVHQGIITELQDYRFLHLNNISTQANPIELLLKENGEHCFIQITPIFWGDIRGDCYFPETAAENIAPLNELILQKEAGHRAILVFCVQHTGVKCIRPADMMHPLYSGTLRKAVALGVEVIAYRASINLREIKLETRIPVLLSEDIAFG